MSTNTAAAQQDAPEDDQLQLDESVLETLDPAWNLQQRHAAIMRALAKVGGVATTGKNRFKRPALSIEDVDLLLERLMGRYGVVSDFEWVMDGTYPKMVQLQTRDEDGAYERWEVAIVSIIRDDRAPDVREEERRLLFDVGSNPSAAVSFALKRHKRELYHLGAVKEGNSDESGWRDRPSRSDLAASACPQCGNIGALGYSSKKNSYYCAKNKGGCGADLPSLEPTASASASPNGGTTDDGYAELEALNAQLGDKRLAPPVLKARAGRPDGYAKTKAELLSLLPDTAEATS